MSSLVVYRSLAAADARNVFRDPLLRWLVLLTPALGLLVRIGVPPAAMVVRARFGFDLTEYYALIMSILPLAAAAMVGTVVGFLLLDQRDDQTMMALLVTPLSLTRYLRYRMLVLMPVCVALSYVTALVAGLTQTTAAQLMAVSIVAAPLAPIYALFLGSVASNKVQGFALIKALGIVLVPSIAAYFVKAPWQIAFGLIPHYWPLKVYWLFDSGASTAALGYASLGLAWQTLVLVLLARFFGRVVRR